MDSFVISTLLSAIGMLKERLALQNDLYVFRREMNMKNIYIYTRGRLHKTLHSTSDTYRPTHHQLSLTSTN